MGVDRVGGAAARRADLQRAAVLDLRRGRARARAAQAPEQGAAREQRAARESAAHHVAAREAARRLDLQPLSSSFVTHASSLLHPDDPGVSMCSPVRLASSPPIRRADRRRCSATSSGGAGIAPLERVQQQRVVADVVRARIRRVVAQQHPRLGDERLVRARQPRAAGERDQLAMEVDVGGDHRLGDAVVAARRRVQARQRRAHRLEVERLGRLQRPQRGARLDRLARGVHVEAVLQRQQPHEAAAVRHRLDQALLRELPQRLADHAAAGAEHPRQVLLAQLLALRDVALDDRPPHLAHDDVSNRRTLHAGELPVADHLRPWTPLRPLSTILQPAGTQCQVGFGTSTETGIGECTRGCRKRA